MIDKILSASTGNITQTDSEKLAEEDAFSVGNFEYGFFIFTNTAENSLSKYSTAFGDLVRLAKQLDCRFICLDCDAEPVPGLRSFVW